VAILIRESGVAFVCGVPSLRWGCCVMTVPRDGGRGLLMGPVGARKSANAEGIRS
jgi:hypothetical protein